MRIALCLSGQPRTWRETRETLLRFFAGHELTVFLHTWREGDPAELAEVIAAYAPRTHLVEERPLFVAEKRLLAERFPLRPPLTVFDMFHSVAESLKLAQAQGGAEAFDLVVRARFDAMFAGSWSGEAPGPGELVIPDDYPDPASCNDQLAIGRPTEMQAYAGLSDWLRTALAGYYGECFRPELILRTYLEQVRGLRLKLRPFAMRLRRESQAGAPFEAMVEDPLFHAQKHEAWEAFAAERFPDVAADLDFQHPSRLPLELDRALAAWLSERSAKDAFQLLSAPWPDRIRAVDAFIAEQAGGLDRLDAQSYRGVRMICAMLLQRMDRAEPMTLESFLVHALSANGDDMRQAAAWRDGAAAGLDALPGVLEGLGPLTQALSFAEPLTQPAIGVWRQN